MEVPTQSTLAVSVEERLATYEDVWNNGGIIDVAVAYIDTMANPAANELLAEIAREKIRAVVDDPETAETLCPYDYPIGAKRLCVETGYYETFNRDNVRLVDIRRHEIKTITEHGIDLADETLDFDVLVFATGFDAMTGALVNVDIAGRNGLSLKDAWTGGPLTYLGLMVAGFPNLFMVTGPGSPSVLSNMLVSIEQHVEWISDCIADMRDGEFATIEPTRSRSKAGWRTSTTTPRSRSTRRRTRGTWARMCPANPVSSCRTAEGSIGIGRSATKLSIAGTSDSFDASATAPSTAPMAWCDGYSPMSRSCSNSWSRVAFRQSMP